MPKSVILFISNPNYFLNLVSCLIQLFDFESLDFCVNLEKNKFIYYFFCWTFPYSVTCFDTCTLTCMYKRIIYGGWIEDLFCK